MARGRLLLQELKPLARHAETCDSCDKCGPFEDVYEEGLYVKIKGCSEDEARQLFRAANETINSSMTGLLGTGGVIKRTREDKCALYTPDSQPKHEEILDF